MFFLKNKKSGNILGITLVILILFSWITSMSCLLIKKEYEKIMTKPKEKNYKKIIENYYERYLRKVGVENIIKKDNKIIWNQNLKSENIKKNEEFIIEEIWKYGKKIYDKNKNFNSKKYYREIIKSFSSFNKINNIEIIFLKEFLNVKIGEKQFQKIKIRIKIKSEYFYDKDFNIVKNLLIKIGGVYVE